MHGHSRRGERLDSRRQILLRLAEHGGAFRAHDPCFGCSTHFAVGHMPLTVEVFDSQKQLLQKLQR
ncbi:MAG TPA: hypothetical protein VJ066_01580 [Candidatus Bathyarchaeia archaeon]|nr:hypothetical protein [Candidatus Bathyarchaeia archaeon]